MRQVAEVIDRYSTESAATAADAEYREFLMREYWEHTTSEQSLLAEASSLVDKAHLVGASVVIAFHEACFRLVGGQTIADRALDKWIVALQARNLTGEVSSDAIVGSKIHPRIVAEFTAINSKGQANTSALDACLHISRTRSWGPRQEIALQSASVSDMEAIIRTSSLFDLQEFMAKMLEWCNNQAAHEPRFGSAMDHFVLACQNIRQDAGAARLGKLIDRMFAASNLSERLAPLAAVSGPLLRIGALSRPGRPTSLSGRPSRDGAPRKRPPESRSTCRTRASVFETTGNRRC